MILTLTPNPSVDHTVILDSGLVRGEVHRVRAALSEPGGKGVNISRAACAADVPTLAVFPAPAQDPYLTILDRAGVPYRAEPCSDPVRTNIAVTEPDGTTTKLNHPGPVLTDGVRDRLADAVVQLAYEATWVVLSGSLPPGCPVGWYGDLVVALRGTGAKVAVDTSDAALWALGQALATDATAAPHVMKPNGAELASLVGGDAAALEADPHAAATAAARLVEQGVETVLATLGGNGAVLVTAAGAWHATPPPVEVVSTVGAGDSSLFGYLYADLADTADISRPIDPARQLRTAVAYGSAAAALPGTSVPTPDQIRPEAVTISRLPITGTSGTTSTSQGRPNR